MIRAVKMQFTAQYAKGEITYFEFYPMIRGRPLSQIMIEHIYWNQTDCSCILVQSFTWSLGYGPKSCWLTGA